MDSYHGDPEDDPQMRWKCTVERNVHCIYLLNRCYPESCKSNTEKRNFRKGAQKFIVLSDLLYCKKDGANLALVEKEEQRGAFQVNT